MKKKRKTTNAEYAEKMAGFRLACEDAKVKPTTRQASKWRRRTGAAFYTRQAYKGE